MKKLIISTLLLVATLALQAEETWTSSTNSVNLKIANPSESKIVKTLALPSRSASVSVKSCTIDFFDAQGKLVSTQTDKSRIAQNVKITNSFVLREMYGHTLEIQLENTKDGKTSKIRNLELEVRATDKLNLPKAVSPVFLPAYKSLADNFSSSYLNDLPTSHPKMLIISRSALSSQMQYFINWKNEKGIETDMVNLETIGTTNTQIKNYIAAYYNDPNKRPDYLLLVGDVDLPYEMPSFYYSAENDVSDLPYALIDGDDYFPELITGRFSVDTGNELLTVIKKIISYEKTPYTENPAWFKKALLVAGNYSDTAPIPTTPTEVSKWLKEKMLKKGYTSVDEIYYAPPEYTAYPGTGEIVSSWNSGAGFVSYRGWGNAYGWHYPEFKAEHLDNLSNGYYLPVVTSIVCGTGNFAQTTVDPCFAEKVLRLGTPTAPKGGVGVIAPSDLHTSTKYNNAIFSGFYGGLLDEGIFSFGAAFLRGKTELYRNFPLEHNVGSQVQFYFNVYNLLGDPSMAMWSSVPQNISCTLPDNIILGTNYLDISSNITNGYACAVKNGLIIGRTVIKNGQGVLYFDNNSTDPVKVTLTGDNYKPLIKDIVVQQAESEALTVQSVTGEIIQSQTCNLAVTLKNYGLASPSSVNGQLKTTDEFVSVVEGNVTFGVFSSEQSVTKIFKIAVTATCPSGRELPFSLELSSGKILKFTVLVKGLTYQVIKSEVVDADQILSPGEQAPVKVTVKNSGNSPIAQGNASLRALTNAVTIVNGQTSYSSIAANAQVELSFVVSAKNETFVGRNAGFELTVTDQNGLKNSSTFYLTIGNVNNTHPTGPDQFGYYAYDSYDVAYSEKPTYNWQEIDPNLGGDGTVILMKDDEVKTLKLPMNFKYYGVQPDSITICSNGWVSFLPTKITNFTNWLIPAGLGAYGMVAPYWDDLIGKKLTQGNEKMRVCYKYDSVNHLFIVEWNECYNNYDDTSLEKFQAVFYDPNYYQTSTGNGPIVFNYHTINNVDQNNNYATVGIENYTQDDGLLYTYAKSYPASATPLTAGLSIKFTTNAPDPFVGIESNDAKITSYGLAQNYPNPFNNTTAISYQLPQNSIVQLTILNQNGQVVKDLFKGFQQSGRFALSFDATGLNSGVYFIKMTAGQFTQVKKCLLVK